MSTRESVYRKPKRAVLRFSEKDFSRLRVLLAQNELTWQGVLTDALNAWLKKRGEKQLEDSP